MIILYTIIVLCILLYLLSTPNKSHYIKTDAILSGIYSFGRNRYTVRFVFTTENGKEVSILADKSVGLIFITKHHIGDKFKIAYDPYNLNRIDF